jgi:hypothetical protein
MSKNNITKEELKNLIVKYAAASDYCRQVERSAREARAEADELKMHLVGLHKMGVVLKSGKLEADVVETQRDGYFVKPSVRVSLNIRGIKD